MLNKNDPLIAAVQKVMQTNQTERDAIKAVNEKFGVADRRALPRERQHEWDSTYKSILSEGLHPNQQKLDVHEPEKDKLTSKDFKMLRAKKKPMEEEKKMKGDDPCWKGYEMIGMKKKGGKEVPNCVPVKEEGDPSKAIRGDVVTGGSSVTSVAPKEKSVTPSDQSALKNKIQSIMKEAKTNPYAIGMAAVKKSTGDQPPMEKKNITKAHKIAKKIIAKKKMNEGFNNRHDLSVTASAEKQVVAEQTSPMPVSGVQNSSWFSRKTDMQRATQDASKVARLRAMRKKSPALDTTRDPELDKPGLRKAGVEKGFSGPKGRAREKAVDDISRETLKTVAPYAATGGPIGNLIGRGVGAAVTKGYQYLKNLSKTAPAVSKTVQTTSQAAPKTTQTAAQSSQVAAPAVSQVANNFRANVANRRYNVAGAQQRPPQSVTPAAQPVTQSSVPSVAQGSGQANRLAATRRPESGPWGSTQAAASGSKLRVPPGGFAANLQRARQQAQASRAGVNTAQATQAATRAASARQSSQALGGLGQASNATNILRARQSSQALGGFGRATSSLGNIVRKNPKLAAGAAAGAAMTGFAATKVGNQPPKAQAQTSTAGKDKPGTGPGQGSGAPTGPENIKMATQNTQGSYDKMTFSQAFAAARKQAGGAGGKFKYKGKEYQTNVKGTGTTAKPQEKYQAASKLKTVAPPTQTTTTKSVAGGQGIAALPSGPAKSAAPVPTARPANVGSAGPARPTMAANAQAAGQMAVDRMRAQNMAKSQTSSMSAGMSSAAPTPKSTPPKPISGGAGR